MTEYDPRTPNIQEAPQLRDFVDRELNVIAGYLDPDITWDDLRVSLSTAKPGASNPPGFAKFADDGSGSTGVFAYFFDKATEEDLFFEAQLPHGYIEGTDIYPHLHWAPTTTSTNVVRWGLEYVVANPNGTYGNTTIVYVNDAGDGTAKKGQLAAFDAIDGSALTISAVFLCRLFRHAGNGADNMDSDAVGLSFDFHYQADARGSRQEYVK